MAAGFRTEVLSSTCGAPTPTMAPGAGCSRSVDFDSAG